MSEDDSIIGPVERNLAHAQRILHRSGVVFLVHPNRKVLIQHRSPLKEIFPNCFDCSCAFHVIFGETYGEAAVRELKEETGVAGELKYLGKFLHHDPPEYQIVAVFRCESDAPIAIDQAEAVTAQFYSEADVDSIVATSKITPWLREGWKIARP